MSLLRLLVLLQGLGCLKIPRSIQDSTITLQTSLLFTQWWTPYGIFTKLRGNWEKHNVSALNYTETVSFGEFVWLCHKNHLTIKPNISCLWPGQRGTNLPIILWYYSLFDSSLSELKLPWANFSRISPDVDTKALVDDLWHLSILYSSGHSSATVPAQFVLLPSNKPKALIFLKGDRLQI